MRHRGFMLIELAVASFVISVAVLALAAILHLGQRAATDSDAATRAALFADDVLATLRLMNDQTASDPDPDAWRKLWARLDPDSSGGTVITQLTGFASGVWVPDGSGALPCIDTSPGVHTNFWCPAGVKREAGGVKLVRADFALRYAISIAHAGETVDTGRGTEEARFYSVTLHVWSGTSLASESSDTTFFAIFSNQRRLP